MHSGMDATEITAAYDLEPLCIGRNWHIQSFCAHTGEGLQEGMDWLSHQLKDALRKYS